jgi:hypothetical protein
MKIMENDFPREVLKAFVTFTCKTTQLRCTSKQYKHHEPLPYTHLWVPHSIEGQPIETQHQSCLKRIQRQFQIWVGLKIENSPKWKCIYNNVTPPCWPNYIRLKKHRTLSKPYEINMRIVNTCTYHTPTTPNMCTMHMLIVLGVVKLYLKQKTLFWGIIIFMLFN